MAAIQGISYPFKKGTSGIPATAEDRDIIRGSIRQIMETQVGERVMRPDFGTYIHEIVFEHDVNLLNAKARRETYRALGTWEPRIDILSVAVNVSGTVVTIDVFYEFLSEADDVQVSYDRGVS